MVSSVGPSVGSPLLLQLSVNIPKCVFLNVINFVKVNLVLGYC